MKKLFHRWLDEFENEPELESWSFSRKSASRLTEDVDEWARFIHEAFNVRSQRIPVNTTCSTYLWFDEQASQLRLATSECNMKNLPFGCSVKLVRSPEPIIASWLSGLDLIPHSELEEVEFQEDVSGSSNFELIVWAEECRGA